MENEIKKRIEALRELMKSRGIDAYLIPTADFHESEYVGGHFKCRQFMTGFTGTAGTAVITLKEAGLWTDGRYFVQAARQLKDSGVTLHKMGVEGVPSVEDYLLKALPEGGTLGFDGRVVNDRFGSELEKRLSEKHVTLSYEEDLAGSLWKDRPPLPKEPIWILEEQYAGEPAEKKLAKLKAVMEEKKATVHILTTLDDIIWLLNIRGNDVPCTPVVLSYLVMTRDRVFLFIQPEVLNSRTTAYLSGIGVTIRPYYEIYQMAPTFKYEHVMLERGKVNYTICKSLDETVKLIDTMNPTSLAKAVKNPVELDNLRKAHLKDGAVMVRYIYWLKKNVGKLDLDEITASNYLDQLRRDCEGNLDLSFATISAYADNAAMCHYKATGETARKLEPRGLYLVDSGGQYLEGTTDITRTIALGEVTPEQKKYFTLVAASMLRLLSVKFLHGCHGYNLDYAARELLWREGLDFNHGTGHGVGYLGGVHERPNGVRWRAVPERQDQAVLEAGMVTSDEPGLYIEGKFGIRTENLMLCVKAEKNEYGQFMQFENLTWAPIDLDAIDPAYLDPRDKELLNRYHKRVYEKIAPALNEEERKWLLEATRQIS